MKNNLKSFSYVYHKALWAANVEEQSTKYRASIIYEVEKYLHIFDDLTVRLYNSD